MKWTVHGRRSIYTSPWVELWLDDVEIPGGERFEHHVVRMRPTVTALVFDDAAEHVLLLWRHRFITDTWGWEVPGGWIDVDEDPAEAIVREVEEETGWRPREARPLVSFQPMLGSADAENRLFISHGADHTGRPPDINETQRVEWISLASVPGRIERGEVAGAGSLVGLLHVLAFMRT